MPREFRKRGKKAKKNTPQHDLKPIKHDQPPHEPEHHNLDEAGPSWIISTTPTNVPEEPNLEAPFGYLDADVKAYFRTVDVQIRNWQENGPEVNAEDANGNADVDPNEGMSPLYHTDHSAMTELSFVA